MGGVAGTGQIELGQHRARLHQRDAAALGDLARHRLQPAAHHAGEAAQRALGDRHIREAADVQVQHALLALRGGSILLAAFALVRRLGIPGARAVERADQRERGEIDALGAQPGVLHRAQQALHHLALGGDNDHALARPVRSVEHAERVVVKHRGGQRHRHLILGLEAHCRVEILAVCHRRQLQRAQHGALVGEAHPHALAETGVAEELLQRQAKLALVDHLALAHDVRSEGGPAARSTTIPPLTCACTAAM